MKKYLLSFLLIISSLSVIGQTIIKGKLKDAETSDVLIGANVSIKGTTEGGMTDIVGDFSFSTSKQGNAILVISYVGYETTEKSVTISGSTLNLGNININPSAIGLSEVEILADFAIDRKTPVAVSTIKPEMIEEKLGTQEFPEILKSTPGIYATKAGGGFGDARVNIRGFRSVNVGVLINGMPVNDMENGRVYWSNWANLTDVARSIQVQRGLGASKLAIPSIGGTINVVTKTTDADKGGEIKVGMGAFGQQNQGIKLSTGLMENGFAVTFAGTHRDGKKFAKGTEYEGWSYFLSIAKKINEKHELVLTTFGAPQEHGQRRSSLEADGSEGFNYGIDYNKDIGYYKGQPLNSRVNFYHKPVFILNHYWRMSPKTDLATSAYASFGTGGGSGFKGNYDLITRDNDGEILFDKIAEANVANGIAGSALVLRNSVNNHNWYGILSSLTTELNSSLSLNTGIDLRHYRGEHYREARNLLGGEYYLDNDNLNKPNNFVRVGDKMDYHNDGLVLWEGVFAQLEYSQGDLSAFVSTALSNTSFKRIDYFTYLDSDPNQTTDFQHFLGYSFKGGANYNLNENHNIFVNAGYFSKAPFFDAAFIDFSNIVDEKAENEKIISFELGYGFRGDKLSLNLNGYYTKWMDRQFSENNESNAAEQSFEVTRYVGVDALHRGIELDFVYKPIENLSINGMASFGDWEWLNDLNNINTFDENGNIINTSSVFIGGVKVGDAAQTTYSLGANYELIEGFKLGLDYNFYGDNYFQFEPTSRSDVSDKGKQAQDIEDFALFDANFSYKFNIGEYDATFYFNANNLLDEEYISDGDEKYGIYYGSGREWSVGMKFKF